MKCKHVHKSSQKYVNYMYTGVLLLHYYCCNENGTEIEMKIHGNVEECQFNRQYSDSNKVLAIIMYECS